MYKTATYSCPFAASWGVPQAHLGLQNSLDNEAYARLQCICTLSTKPCRCGYYNYPEKECTCGPGIVQKYLNKVSGPLLDRINLHVEVTQVAFSELRNQQNGEDSATIRERVIKAREIQAARYNRENGVYANAQMSSKQLREICRISAMGENILKRAMEKLNLSARAYDRILKVSRTIADLAGSNDFQPEPFLAEAIHYRRLYREGWAG